MCREDLTYGSYGLDQCLDLAERALRAATDVPRRTGRSGESVRAWRGDDRHHSAARALRRRVRPCTRRRLHLGVGTASSATAPPPCTPSSSRPRGHHPRPEIELRQSDTDVAVTTPAHSARPAQWWPGRRACCAGTARGVPGRSPRGGTAADGRARDTRTEFVRRTGQPRRSTAQDGRETEVIRPPAVVRFQCAGVPGRGRHRDW